MSGYAFPNPLGALALAIASLVMPPLAASGRVCEPEFARRPQANPPLVNEPALLDPEAALQEVRRAYRSLNPSPSTGPVRVLMLVDQDGAIADVKLYRSSSRIELDSVAMAAVRTFRFRPAENREGPGLRVAESTHAGDTLVSEQQAMDGPYGRVTHGKVAEGRILPLRSTCTGGPLIGGVIVFGLAVGIASCTGGSVADRAPLTLGEALGIELTDLDGNPVDVRPCQSLYLIDPDCSVCIREALGREVAHGEVWVSVGSAVRSREFMLLFGEERPVLTLIPSFGGLSVDEQLRLMGAVSTPRTVVLDVEGSVDDVRVGFARDLVAPSCQEEGTP